MSLLAGCRRGPVSNYVPPEFVFVPEVVELPEEISEMRNMVYSNGRLYFWSYVVTDEETWSGEGRIFSMDIDGSNLTELSNYSPTESPYEDADGNMYISSMIVDNEGNIWLVEEGRFFSVNYPEDFDEENPADWDRVEWIDYGTVITIRKLDQTGAELLSVDVTDIFSGYDWIYVSAFTIDSDGNIYLGVMEEVVVLDSNGTVRTKISSGWVQQLVRLPDGRVGFSGWTDGYGYALRIIDLVTGGLGETIELPDNAWNLLSGSEDYPIVFQDGLNLYSFDPETGESERVINWVESSVSPDGIENIIFLPDGRLLFTNMTYDWVEYNHTFELNILTRVPYSDLPVRTVLTLATVDLDWSLRNHIIKFNRENLEYRIHVIDYSEFRTDDDWFAGITKLSTDIIAGNVPDMIEISYRMPFKQYVARGLLMDLYPLIDADPEINRSDLMESVFRAAEMDGGLYRIFSTFTINTIVGHPSVVGPEMGWTMDEFDAVLRANPQADMPLGQWLTRETFLNMAVSLGMDEYVDWAKGTVSFDSGEFALLLESSNRFPPEIDYNNIDGDFWIDQNELIAQGRQIMSSMYISDFQSMQWSQMMFGGELAFKGFPTKSGNGNSLEAHSGIALTTRTIDKDGAWQFMRALISDDWQRTNRMWGFPTNKAAFDRMAEDAKNMDDMSYGMSWGDGEVMYAKPITQADVDLIMSLIDNSFGIISYDDALMNIINEGASDFFNGSRSAQDAARIIQSRAAIYVSEQS